jgi:MoaA/NifB/PqqE/SkfB family radical SAM enzyme
VSPGVLTGSTPVMDGLAERRQLPLGAHFDLTYRCNEQCVHCYLEPGEVT